MVNSAQISITPRELRANRFDLASRLADDLAHEMKNPLHAMVINLELIRRRAVTSPETAVERVAVVESEVARVNRLLDAFLQIVRPSRDGSGRTDPAAALREMLPLLEAQAKVARVNLQAEISSESTLVPLPRDEFKQVALNLCANALEAAERPGGTVRVELSLDGDGALLRISDSGSGVPEEFIEKLGTPGFSTRTGRAGLGLAVVRGLVERVGGSVAIEPTSDLGGAAFTLRIPRLDSA